MKISKNIRSQVNITAAWVAALIMIISVFSVAVLPVNAEQAAETTKITGVMNGAYEIVKYDFDAVVEKTHSYTVTEKITVNLPDDLQKIQFAVPDGNFRVSELTVNGEDIRTNTLSDDKYIEISDNKALTRGEHTYEIRFEIREYADRDDTQDIFFLNALLPNWLQPITEVSVNVQFPDDFPWDDMQYYAGQFGVQDVNTKLDYVADEATHSVSIHGERIPENFGITLKAKLPDGYWEGMLDGAWAITFMMVLAIAVAAVMFILWMIGGRDPKFEKVVQTHPIEGISPVEVGYISIGRIRVRDIIALIIYLGTRGYLKIIEYAPKKYNLVRTADPDPAGEEKFIRNAYEILFEDVPKERGVDMHDLGPRLRRIKDSIREDVASGFSGSDMLAYTPISKVFRIAGTVVLSIATAVICALRYSYVYSNINFIEAIVVGILSMVLLTAVCRQFDRYYHSEQRNFVIRLIVLSAAFVISPVYVAIRTILLTGQWIAAILAAVMILFAAFFIVIMRSRARGNAALVHRFKALGDFIYHPTPKEIAANYFADKNYYYEIMPYAYLFDGLDTWAISFASLDVAEPEWYSDESPGHAITNLRTETNVVDYAKDIKNFARTIDDAYHNRSRRRRK